MTGVKHDDGKVLAGTIEEYFPRALLAIAGVSTFGAKKYKRMSWQTVDQTRYADAKARHSITKHLEDFDKESGLLHMAHEAWNTLAVLEIELRRREDEQANN